MMGGAASVTMPRIQSADLVQATIAVVSHSDKAGAASFTKSRNGAVL